MMEDYKVHTITFYPFNSDTVSGMLWSLPIEGITEEDTFIKAYSKVSSGLTSEAIKELLDNLVQQNLIEKYEVTEETEKQQNWNEYWESRLNIIHVTDKITIKPTTKEYTPEDDEIVITIDPKMSFGTGEHETTKLCVTFVEKYVRPGMTVIDLGSGTGILGIASAKLGAKKVYAVDNDEWCLENGKENVYINSVENIVDVVLGEIEGLKVDSVDAVIANINKNVLMGLGEQTAHKIKQAGKLVISGFYNNDIKELSEYFNSNGFKLIEQNTINNWSSIVFEKE